MGLRFMVNRKDNEHYLQKIITDLKFIVNHTKGLTDEEFEENEVLTDSVMFRLIQISENSSKLSEEFKNSFPDIPWKAIKGLRNRIVHEYGKVDFSVIYFTVIDDIPMLLKQIEQILVKKD